MTCTLFASLDDPTPVQRGTLILLALCIPLVVIYQFFILPAIGGFELLCVALAFTLIPAGLLMAIPAYAPIGLALALAFCIEMSLQASYTADLASIVNSDSAFVVGGLAGLTVTRLMRVIGTQVSARRLMRATYRDLASLANGRALPTRDEWASRMLDRVALLLYRQPRFELRPQHEFADALEGLRLGVNIIETRSIASGTSKPSQQALAAMLACLAPYFRGLARGRVAQLDDELLRRIDIVIDDVTACSVPTHAGVAAIVGMRRTLYPNSPPYRIVPVAAQVCPEGTANVT